MKEFYVIALLLIFNACNGKQKAETTEMPNDKKTFQMVSVPSVITEPDKRAEYLVQHYWDNFDFSDTTYISLAEVTEQALSNYIDVLQYVPSEAAAASLKKMMAKTEVDSAMFAHFSDLYEKYLYDPNSPLRNEELYIPVLEAVVASSRLDDEHKIRPAHLLELAQKNRIGSKAFDFTYTLANGQTHTLYSIQVENLVLFFYNPDCPACKEITGQLDASPVVGELIKQKRLKILALYPDEDLNAWKAHTSLMPQSWINAYDGKVTLKNDEMYDLKAIPTLYLLNKDKQVVQKDVTFGRLEEFLKTNIK
ncbi:MAG: DUF5106 domain-containing protein [Tannerellaceae bacterium]